MLHFVVVFVVEIVVVVVVVLFVVVVYVGFCWCNVRVYSQAAWSENGILFVSFFSFHLMLALVVVDN